MAEKRYYWLKLKENYFDSPKIKKLRRIAGGDTYTIIYLKMQLLSVSNGGVISFERIEDTFEEELALKLDEQIEDIQLTLVYLKQQGLIEAKDEEYLFVEACNNIGTETSSAERVRRLREKEVKILKEPKSNALRQRQFKAKESCKQIQHIPFIEDYTNNKRYNGNYYLVLKRDKFKCSICNSIENLCVHHIDGFYEDKPENNEENKMITLCRECHSGVHSSKINIPNELLQSIDYFDISNKNNKICNTDVTEVKQDYIYIYNSISNIFNYWNSKDIIKHKNISEKINKAITKALKTYKEEDIIKYIDRYNTVIKDRTYFFDYKWTFEDFLNRKDGISSFTDEGSKWVSYNNQKKVIDKKSSQNFAQREYTKEELNNVFDSLDDIDIG